MGRSERRKKQNMSDMFRLRIGNIEVRECAGNYSKYEVVKYSPNELYGKADEYRTVTPLGEVVYKRGMTTYSESCFKNPETCYTVSHIRLDKHEHALQVDEVLSRPFELNKEDYKSWCDVMYTIFNTPSILKKIINDAEDV